MRRKMVKVAALAGAVLFAIGSLAGCGDENTSGNQSGSGTVVDGNEGGNVDGGTETIRDDGGSDIDKQIEGDDNSEASDGREEYAALVKEWTDIMLGSEWQGSFDEYDREGTFWILTLNEDGTFTHYNAESANTLSGTYELIFAEYSDDLTEPIIRLSVDDSDIIEYTFYIYDFKGETRLGLDDDPSTPYFEEDILTTPVGLHPTYTLQQ
ncbi:MAG: hypothetical protein J1E01_01895 [Acetatifactor sp.]|nr:hypothetical protein [Acetatifactor sp.]